MIFTKRLDISGEVAVDISSPRGKSINLAYQVLDGGVPIDLTGWEAKKQISFPTPRVLTSSDYLTIFDAPNGIFYENIPDAVAGGFPLGPYRYDTWIVDGDYSLRVAFGRHIFTPAEASIP